MKRLLVGLGPDVLSYTVPHPAVTEGTHGSLQSEPFLFDFLGFDLGTNLSFL